MAPMKFRDGFNAEHNSRYQFQKWYSVIHAHAQSYGNGGAPGIAITYDHIATVRVLITEAFLSQWGTSIIQVGGTCY